MIPYVKFHIGLKREKMSEIKTMAEAQKASRELVIFVCDWGSIQLGTAQSKKLIELDKFLRTFVIEGLNPNKRIKGENS